MSVGQIEGLLQFITFLQSLNTPQLVLAAHNATFDSSVLVRSLLSHNLFHQFTSFVSGFMDTKTLFRELYPNLLNFKQSTIANHVLQENYNAHNSLDDTLILARIFLKSNHAASNLESHSFSCSYIMSSINYSDTRRKNLPSLSLLINNGTISKGMAEKIAGSGLSFLDLECAHLRGGLEGNCE